MKNKRQSTSDAELLAKFHAGDRNALGALFKRHEKFLIAIVMKKARDPEKARDIIQDAYLKATLWLGERKYTESGSFKHWLARIANNIFIDECRRKKRVPGAIHLSESDDDQGIYNALVHSVRTDLPNAEELQTRKEVQKEASVLIKNGVRNLPETQRQVLILRYRFKMTFKEIAKMTEVSVNTALGRMRYALINLRNQPGITECCEAA